MSIAHSNSQQGSDDAMQCRLVRPRDLIATTCAAATAIVAPLFNVLYAWDLRLGLQQQVLTALTSGAQLGV